MGVGSETTANIAARFTADCVNLRPRIAIVQGGLNDFASGGSQQTFLANWTAMLDACKAAGIEPVVCKIAPWTNGTNQQMQTRDTWNAALATLAAGYSDAVVVDFDGYVGANRAGGDAGNKWDIASGYGAGDGVHFNGLGYARMAQAILEALGRTGRNAIADAVLLRDVANVEASAGEHSLCYVVLAMSQSNTVDQPGMLTVYKSDGLSEFVRKTLRANPDADPVTGVS
jgi:lysophospholipase L1-like esterase